MVKAYHFKTGFGKVTIEAGTIHTALYRLGHWLESKTKYSISWKKNGEYNADFNLEYITNKNVLPKGYVRAGKR